MTAAPGVAARARALPPWAAAIPSWFGPVACGLAAAAALLALGHPAGLGLAAVAVGLVLAAAAAAPARSWAWVVAAVLLAAAPALRDAGWVVAHALGGAIALTAVAVGGAATWRGVLGAPLRWLAALLPGPVLVARLAARRLESRWGRALPLARGLALAAVLVAAFGGLFAAGDAAFAQLLSDAGAALPDVGDAWFGRLLVALLVAGAAGALMTVSHAPPRERPAPARRRRLGRTEALVALGALDALFVLFVAVQVTALFGGHDHVLRKAGLTYAGYAHQGFGELLAAAALTLGVVAATARWAGDGRLLRGLLGVLCVCTLVILASAHRRLDLYVDVFGASRLRLLAQAQILWVGAVFALVIAAGLRRRAPWLPRAVVTLTAVTGVAFVAADPDRRIAERNAERFERTGRIDETYLGGLSADAVPALVRLPPPARTRTLRELRARLAGGGDGLAAANAARARARALLEP